MSARVVRYHGEALDVLSGLADEFVDAVVTDPPYSLGFMGRTWDEHRALDDDPAFGYYLAGLIDGEGCFRVQRHERGTHSCTFTLKLRADDRAILDKARRWLGAGQIGEVSNGEGHPQVRWAVQDKVGCQQLVDALDKYELRAKKRTDYLAWREAVCEWTSMPRGNRWHGPADQSRMVALKARIEGGRAYVDPPWSGNGYQDWCRLWARECFRVLKPGGHLLAFGGTRTSHRLASAIEDAGFEIRDSIVWLYGSGFPKSLDVSKAIDKAAGTEPIILGPDEYRRARANRGTTSEIQPSYDKPRIAQAEANITAPATDDAKRWAGWGTALKPAHEPIVVARKPLIGTVAANVLVHGTGALNIDATRVSLRGFSGSTRDGNSVCTCPSREVSRTSRTESTSPQASSVVSLEGRRDLPASAPAGATDYPRFQDFPDDCRPSCDSDDEHARSRAGDVRVSARRSLDVLGFPDPGASPGYSPASLSMPCPDCTAGHVEQGRWPANVVLDREGAAAELDAQSGTLKSGANPTRRGSDRFRDTYGDFAGQTECTPARGANIGGASRFFPVFRYQAKAPTRERPKVDGVAHPTVKPLELMRWLVRLVAAPDGIVLDPFAGSGTTLEAAVVEGMRCIGIEREETYLPLIAERMTRVGLVAL